MTLLLYGGAALLCLASLPYWLPQLVVGLRTRIFTRINGEEGIAIPGEAVDLAHFKQVYAHPAADGRSRGAALSDLFWYWLSPGAHIHQEHLEPGPRYDAIASLTRNMLAIPRRRVEELAARCTERVLDEQAIRSARLVRLRALMMPIWAEFYYELVFAQSCPATARKLIVDNADDVVTALKCCGLRHMAKRDRLTRYLIARLEAGEPNCAFPEGLSIEERALYLQGVFFNTAVVQMSEAMTHLLLLIAQHPDVGARIRAEPEDYLERVIQEALRVFPLFGISHRITSAEIALDGRTPIPKGAVLCFSHSEFHRHGFAQPERFDPDRWQRLSLRESSYIPFGVAGNRPCPAQAVALSSMRVAARAILARFDLDSSCRHTRSIPNRGPCLLVPREGTAGTARTALLLAWLRVRDRWEDVGRSLLQLVLGTYMVWEARELRLCARYFEAQERVDGGEPRPSGAPLR